MQQSGYTGIPSRRCINWSRTLQTRGDGKQRSGEQSEPRGRQIYELAVQQSLLPTSSTWALARSTLHRVWTQNQDSPKDVRRTIVKARLLTRSYILQADRAKFNQHQVSGICPLCNSAEEDRLHFIRQCPSTAALRENCDDELSLAIPWYALLGEADKLKLILDSSWFELPERLIPTIESVSANYVYRLHCARQHNLSLRLPRGGNTN